ncbi:MAG: efflux RND transporter permease subunit, partial [Paludibacter sp.]
RVMHVDNYKTPIEKLKKAAIFTKDGTYLPLSTLADVSLIPGVAEINRENLQTIGVVTARLNNRDLGSVMKDIKTALAKIVLPSSYQIEYGGSYAEQQQSFNELLTILILGGLLVFIIVLFMFGDIKISFIVLFVSILSTSGSIIALYLTHTPLNVGSYTGLIMIIGIIGENSIFTIHRFMYFLKENTAPNAIKQAVSTRFRPILMTVFSAVVALSPLALGLGSGAQMHQPLAIAVIGGFLVGLPMLLLVFPSLMVLIFRKSVIE